MYPGMLDEQSVREEWNISQVRNTDSQQPAFNEELFAEQKASIDKQKIVMTTHEEDFASLNKLLMDHMPLTEQDEGEQEIVFPTRLPSSSQFHPAQRQPSAPLTNDENMIIEIGSEQRTNMTTSTEKKGKVVLDSDRQDF